MKFVFFFFMSFLCTSCASAQYISTYVGNGTATWGGDDSAAVNAGLSFPIGICFDNNENLLICHEEYVRKVNKASGIIVRIAGSDTAVTGIPDSVIATTTFFGGPKAATVDKAGNIYISDTWVASIRRINIATGIVERFAGTRRAGYNGDGIKATSANINGCIALCIDTTANNIFLSDEFNYRVRRVDLGTDTITTYAGTGVRGYSGDGGPATAAKLSRILGICVDRHHNLYIGDWDNGRIRKVDTAGIITTYVGTGTSGFSGDGGPATSAQINRPFGLCMDSLDNLYFTDELNQRIRRIDAATKIITTIAGNGTAGFSGDGGAATAARLNNPEGIAIDRDGNIYFSEFYNHRVRKLSKGPAGYIMGSMPDAAIRVYPNPAHNTLHIDGSNLRSYHLFNTVGTLVQAGNLSTNTNTIPTERLPTGVYIVEIITAGGVVRERVLIEQE